MARSAAIGIIGCGVISDTYFKLAPLFKGVEIVACADIAPAYAKAKADQYSVRAMSVDALLKDDAIDAVINLTVPNAHYQVSHESLSAGKHVYSEKPLALTYKMAKKLVAEADKRGLKIGAAPDTFLGGGGQTARKLLDNGTIGDVVAGSAHVMSHGMEHWHPNPTFFFKPGGGPMLDIGPYYLTALVNLLGPVKTVTAMAKKGFAERIVTAEGPMKGKAIKVTTPTTLNGVLEFRSGAQVTIGTSWDVWKHGHANPIELYGTEGHHAGAGPEFLRRHCLLLGRGGRLCRDRHGVRAVRRRQLGGAAGHAEAVELPDAGCGRPDRRGQQGSRTPLFGAVGGARRRRHEVDAGFGGGPELRRRFARRRSGRHP